jgi:hypothetical protein
VKQVVLDNWNITHGFPKILFSYCKMDVNEYTDICRKWLGVKKREYIKQVLESREFNLKYDEGTFNKDNW